MSRDSLGASHIAAAGRARRAGATEGSSMGAIFNVFPLILVPV
jgi:hypothetical protein